MHTIIITKTNTKRLSHINGTGIIMTRHMSPQNRGGIIHQRGRWVIPEQQLLTTEKKRKRFFSPFFRVWPEPRISIP
jgi:hypothetical protein